jgi:mono/diheme cytochrome c family protein
MNRKSIKFLALGAISGYGIAAFGLVLFAKLGLLPVQADVAPSRLEATLLGSALHAAVARRAADSGNPLQMSNENMRAGAALYRQMCSRCHGTSAESDNTFGRSFYPPAPNLMLRRTSYTDSETFWIVKHGIRNTAMPAWGNLLTDEEIWKVVALLRNFDALRD